MSLAKYKIKADLKEDGLDKEFKLEYGQHWQKGKCWDNYDEYRYHDYWEEFDFINQVYRSRTYWDQEEEYNWEWWNDSPERLRQKKLDELLDDDKTQRIGDFLNV
jgi:hypothetical protein